MTLETQNEPNEFNPRSKSGRKPLPQNQKKKRLTIFVSPDDIKRKGGPARFKLALNKWLKS